MDGISCKYRWRAKQKSRRSCRPITAISSKRFPVLLQTFMVLKRDHLNKMTDSSVLPIRLCSGYNIRIHEGGDNTKLDKIPHGNKHIVHRKLLGQRRQNVIGDHVARIMEINAYTVLAGKYEGSVHFGNLWVGGNITCGAVKIILKRIFKGTYQVTWAKLNCLEKRTRQWAPVDNFQTTKTSARFWSNSSCLAIRLHELPLEKVKGLYICSILSV